ncbi:MAG: hypothetical protein U0269_09610 [Polyangiales bacterium]
MRPLRFALLPLFALASGCAPIGFDIPKTLDEQRVTGDPVANAAGQALPAGTLAPITFSVDLTAESNSRRVPIGRVLLKSMSFSITPTAEPAGDTDDFSFIRTMNVYFECTGAGCTLPRVLVASVTNPSTIRTLPFTITPNVNVKPYIDAGVRVVIEADAIPPPDDTTFNGVVVLRVEPI